METVDPEHRTVSIDEGNHRFSGRSSSTIAYVDGLLASPFYVRDELVGCSHMSGLFVRGIRRLPRVVTD